MLKVLSSEEELRIRHKVFSKLTPGSLFDLGQERFFIAVKKMGEKVWEVVELTETNRKKITSGQPCDHSALRFEDMACLNLRSGQEGRLTRSKGVGSDPLSL
jgi:hypothetical protein